MSSASSGGTFRRKDQQRALLAYACAAAAKSRLGDYRIAVNGFRAALLRSGLAASVSLLERNADRGGFKQLMNDLAKERGSSLDKWPDAVRNLPLRDYMLQTRELTAFLGWLVRAVRAVGREDSDA
jgi:CRISPR-associated protein (Cas_Cmr5)